MSPTSALQAELVSIISIYSGDENNSTSILHSSIKSTAHQDALSWLVADQAKWRAEKESLSNAEVMERSILRLAERTGPNSGAFLLKIILTCGEATSRIKLLSYGTGRVSSDAITKPMEESRI